MGKNFAVIFYGAGSILLTIPIALFILFSKNHFIVNSNYLYDILQLFHFKFNLYSIIIIILAITIIIFYELIIYKNKNQFNENYKLIQILIGDEPNIFFNLCLSFLSGFFEELLFRGYIFLLLIKVLNLVNANINLCIIFIIIFLSVIFAFLHVYQGFIAFITSFIFSLIFYLTIMLSSSIWYAIFGHFLFNFFELTIIIPKQKKKFNN